MIAKYNVIFNTNVGATYGVEDYPYTPHFVNIAPATIYDSG